jgi:aryl-alcohol dehydrogenase-like predicted oxidoreductase
MRYRPLGKTGLTVSEIGFGAWGIGGPSPGATSYGPTDDAVSLSTLERAFEQGITLYDTSNAYGDGHSETLIGQAFRQRRTQVVIATKAGFPRFDPDQDFSPGQLRASLEGSLRRLQTDHVDLFQLHSPPIALLCDDPEILATLRSLVQEGKARAFGLSVRAPEDGLIAIRELGFPVLQANLNLLDQRAVDNGLLALAQETGVALIARTPLCFGMLSGRVPVDSVFDPQDHRSRWPRAQIERWLDGSRRFVDAIAAGERVTSAQVALRYCLSHPAVAAAIPGMMRPHEVDENTAASALGPPVSHAFAQIERLSSCSDFFCGRPT